MQLITIFTCVSMFFYQIDIVETQYPDIVQTAINNGNFNTLFSALQAADLVSTLKSGTSFTVFAPNDAAFNKLGTGVIANLLLSGNKEKLIEILKYHVISGRRLTASQISAMNLPTTLWTLGGNQITVSRNGNTLKVNNATVTTPDINAANGIIHVIDMVLMPPGKSLSSSLSLHEPLFLTLVWALAFSYIRFL